jgi:N-acetylmuramoyl-L-alanine amidase
VTTLITETIDTLARTIWGEARGEGPAGMAAVASVILNRAALPRWWGHDVVSCCRHPLQFSCWNADDPNRAKLLAVSGVDPSYDVADAIARLAIVGHLNDTTHGADSYYAQGSDMPPWAKGQSPVAAIGRHLFFRLET